MTGRLLVVVVVVVVVVSADRVHDEHVGRAH